MEAHRLLTGLGAVLLAATLAIHYGSVPGGDDLAYVTGAAMLATFVASFALFEMGRRKT